MPYLWAFQYYKKKSFNAAGLYLHAPPRIQAPRPSNPSSQGITAVIPFRVASAKNTGLRPAFYLHAPPRIQAGHLVHSKDYWRDPHMGWLQQKPPACGRPFICTLRHAFKRADRHDLGITAVIPFRGGFSKKHRPAAGLLFARSATHSSALTI